VAGLFEKTITRRNRHAFICASRESLYPVNIARARSNRRVYARALVTSVEERKGFALDCSIAVSRKSKRAWSQRRVCCRSTQNGAQPAEVAHLIDSGKLKPIVERILPLLEVHRAHGFSQSGDTRGKKSSFERRSKHQDERSNDSHHRSNRQSGRHDGASAARQQVPSARPDAQAGERASERAAALARHGVDVIKGDVDDEATLRRPLAGVWGDFGVR
jgi:Zinc-binding dehydrogenase